MKEKRIRTNKSYPMEQMIRLWKQKTERAKINFGQKILLDKIGKLLDTVE